MQKKVLIVVSLSAIIFSGCAISGAGAGTAIGKQVGGNQGALAGALLGGGIGMLIGNEIDNRRKAIEKIAQQNNSSVVFKDIQDPTPKANASLERVGQSYVITNYGTANNKMFAKIAENYKGSQNKIMINSFSNSQDSYFGNIAAAENNANAIGKLFVDNGIEPSRILYRGTVAQEGSATDKVEIVEMPSEEKLADYAKKTPVKTITVFSKKEKKASKQTVSADGNIKRYASKTVAYKTKEQVFVPNTQNTRDYATR